MAKMLIVRITRHPASPEQIRHLIAAATWAWSEMAKEAGHEPAIQIDGVRIVRYPHNISSANEVLTIVEKARQDEEIVAVEAVLPIDLLNGVLKATQKANIPVLRAIMARKLQEGGQAMFEFVGYEWVRQIVVETKRHHPDHLPDVFAEETEIRTPVSSSPTPKSS